MNKLQELMVITMEECGELIQECSKVLRKSKKIEDIPVANRQKLLEEVGDVYCMIDLIIDNGLMTEEEIYGRAQIKSEKLKKWSKLYGVDEPTNSSTQ